MLPDAELLRRYVAQRDDAAFSELVQRHLALVYASALRRTQGRSHLAREIAQTVFADLARKAGALRHHPALLAWLYRSTRYATGAALREEARRKKLAQAVATMTDSPSSDEPTAEWEQLRPVIDQAIDRLKERDRTVVLLRFFEGLTFAEIGARLDLAENTARMRVERALEKLRRHLHAQGLTSTSAAIGLMLANSAGAAGAPPGLAAVVTSAALSSAPAGLGASVATFLFMSKITAPALSAVVVSGTTLLLWTSFVPHTTARELAALRTENARLTQALSPGASAEALAAVASDVESNILGTARAVEQRSSQAATRRSPTSTPGSDLDAAANAASDTSRHRNRGQANPQDAALSFAWASESGEIDALAKLLWFDPDVRPQAEAVLASMPASLRRDYDTPEKLFALIFAADAIVAPPPGPDLLERWSAVELATDRVAMRAPGSKPQTDYHQYQQTDDGWKFVVPEVAVRHMPAVLTNETLAKTAQR